MPIPPGVFVGLVVAAGGVVMWSGLEKARNRSPLTSTVVGLGAPRRLAAVIGVTVPCIELATVLSVVVGVTPYLSGALFVALGTSFAAAAAWSMVTRRRVACACFGAVGGRLGWHQFAALPLWLVAGWASVHLPATTPTQRLGALAAGMLVLTAARAVPALRQGLRARSDRYAVAGG